MNQRTIIERAYELARSGACRGSSEVRLALKADDYSNADINQHLRGPTLIKQLNRLCREARASRAG
jgi:hypothetical protein